MIECIENYIFALCIFLAPLHALDVLFYAIAICLVFLFYEFIVLKNNAGMR